MFMDHVFIGKVCLRKNGVSTGGPPQYVHRKNLLKINIFASYNSYHLMILSSRRNTAVYGKTNFNCYSFEKFKHL